MSAGCGAGGDGSDEAVAAFGESFDEAGVVGFVGEGVAEFVDCGVEAVFEVDKGVSGPEAFLELFAGDDQAGVFQKDGEDLERAILDFEADAGFAEFAGEQIRLVGAETDDGRKLGRGGHEVSCGYRRNFSTESLTWSVSIAVEKDG